MKSHSFNIIRDSTYVVIHSHRLHYYFPWRVFSSLSSHFLLTLGFRQLQSVCLLIIINCFMSSSFSSSSYYYFYYYYYYY